MMTPPMRTPGAQQGLALPVMLIILVVMLIGSIYLFKSSNSLSLTTSNLAYKGALTKAADLGLMTGFEWLSATSSGNKLLLNADNPANGYVATYNTQQTPSSPGFWIGSRTVLAADGTEVEYVIHRMCSLNGAYDDAGPPANRCVQTAAGSALNQPVGLGESLASDAPKYAGTPQIHYVITARISGPRGGNVINQLVVLIGA